MAAVRAIKQNCNELAELIEGNLITIANELNGQGLLPDPAHREIVNNPPSFQSANKLILHVITRVKINPAQYQVFYRVLENHFQADVLTLPNLDGESVLYCTVCSYSGMLRTGQERSLIMVREGGVL